MNIIRVEIDTDIDYLGEGLVTQVDDLGREIDVLIVEPNYKGQIYFCTNKSPVWDNCETVIDNSLVTDLLNPSETELSYLSIVLDNSIYLLYIESLKLYREYCEEIE